MAVGRHRARARGPANDGPRLPGQPDRGAAPSCTRSSSFWGGGGRANEIELGLYGFSPFGFYLERDSFPSGHALTIFSVAVVACGAFPALSFLWLAIAVYLSMTRALLHAHFVSDVFIGAGIGTIVTREIVVLFYPSLTQGWF